MDIQKRLRNWRQPPPDIEILSPMSPAECHYALTGKRPARWSGDTFLSALQLNGTMSAGHISVRLPGSSVAGDIVQHDHGSRIQLWGRHESRRATLRGDILMIAAIALPFVVYSLLTGSTPIIAFLLALALVFGRLWYRQLRLTWPTYPADADELAEMLAAHTRGSVREPTPRAT